MTNLLRTLLAASMLLGVASTQAVETANGLDLNGFRKNGIQLNRLAFNGTTGELPMQLNGVPLDQLAIR